MLCYSLFSPGKHICVMTWAAGRTRHLPLSTTYWIPCKQIYTNSTKVHTLNYRQQPWDNYIMKYRHVNVRGQRITRLRPWPSVCVCVCKVWQLCSFGIVNSFACLLVVAFVTDVSITCIVLAVIVRKLIARECCGAKKIILTPVIVRSTRYSYKRLTANIIILAGI